ncbi:G1/S-specific cyclin-E isoform X2 [Copidosoma floridanum]|uniref:G1/S-specific cyclin-E isoform X2 n=1 Tax=Copidosoma floridanum TaxID=29053 RepID=UPI000C6FB56D|nr:G1/S-specific cyclin-E isoform X2 [Copidosoma floridanum]
MPKPRKGRGRQTKLQVQNNKTVTLRRKRKASSEKTDDLQNHPPNKVQVVTSNDSDNITSVNTTTITTNCDLASPTSVPYTPKPSIPPLDFEPAIWSEMRTATCFLTPSTHNENKRCPLPNLDWADPDELWQLMLQKDQETLLNRDSQCFSKHPTLQPRMRAILLDWLIEVCEVYKLHRETYYRAMDFIDRYLSRQSNLPKNQLQLVGVTCLFIAAKFEEIYPPKISEFAYVTDAACTEQEILAKERIILKDLEWKLESLIPPTWLSIFMQTECGDMTNPNTFIYPQFEGLQYSQASQLVDLATLDEGSLKFSYRMLAVSAISHTMGRETALRVSRMTWEQLAPCAQWMSTFAVTVSEESAQRQLRSSAPIIDNNNAASGLRASVPNINIDQSHRIQSHTVDLEMLELSQQRQSMILADCLELEGILDSEASSPAEIQEQSDLLTPPSSIQKNPSTSPRLPDQNEPYT